RRPPRECSSDAASWRKLIRETRIGRVLCVLLVRFSSIGDILLTTPLARALRRRHPEARIVYVTKQAMIPLVSDNPHVHDVVGLEPDEPIRHLARRLRALRPTHGLDLHGSVRSAALRLLVRCPWTGYRKRKLARSPTGCAPRGTGPWCSAGRRTADSPSSSQREVGRGAGRSRARPGSSRCRRPARCWGARGRSSPGTRG